MKILLTFSFLISLAVADENSADFTEVNNLFASNTYKKILKESKSNFLVSPFSAETVLAFTLSGCKGETAEELRRALHLPNNKEKIENDIKTILPQIKNNADYALHTANKMYIQEKFSINEEFKTTAKEVYYSELENIDFVKNVEAAEKINTWVEKETNNKIQNLISPENLNNKSRVVLVNALYLKADWQIPFRLVNTQKNKFYKTANDVIEVDTLHQYPVPAFRKNVFKYYECPHFNAKFLELNFKGDDASMTIILPNEKEGLSTLEDQIDKVFSPHNLTLEFVNIAIPKFKIETEIDFKPILKSLGVSKAFDEHLADLSGIAGEQGDLLIDSVVQKSFIDVSENGVEAAAATRVLVRVPLSGFSKPPKQFIADHPFIFYIKIKNIIVFAGRVTDPK